MDQILWASLIYMAKNDRLFLRLQRNPQADQHAPDKISGKFFDHFPGAWVAKNHCTGYP